MSDTLTEPERWIADQRAATARALRAAWFAVVRGEPLRWVSATIDPDDPEDDERLQLEGSLLGADAEAATCLDAVSPSDSEGWPEQQNLERIGWGVYVPVLQARIVKRRCACRTNCDYAEETWDCALVDPATHVHPELELCQSCLDDAEEDQAS